jgi:hypothetical protein
MGLKIKNSKNIVTDGLVLNLDASDKLSYSGSGSTWTDRSSSGNNATLVNSPAFSNNGLGLDDTDDRITFNTPFTDESNLTVTVWFKGQAASGAANGFGYLLHNGPTLSTGDSYITIGEHGTNNQYFAALNGRYDNMTFGVTTDTNTVHQITLTWDGSAQKVYFDGEYKKGIALGSIDNTWNSTTSIGDFRASTYRAWDGAVYSCCIYNKALTQAEISQNYNATKGRFGL